LAAACGGTGTPPTAPSNSSNGADASTAAPRPAASGAEAEFKGLVEAVPPATPALTFRAAGRTVVTTGSTAITEDGIARAFADLAVGDSVEVKGTLSGDTVTATRVEIEDRVNDRGPAPVPAPGPGPGPNPGPNPGPRTEVEIRGAVAGLTGTASSFQFTVNGATVKGDAGTELENDDDEDDDESSDTPASFSALANGVEVHVKGTQNADGSVQAREIEIEDDADDDDDDEARVRGTLAAVTGTCPSISSSVAGVKFTTSAATRFDNACSSFSAGNSVEVRGRRNADGSIAASRMKKR
jgi:hypothetical protein